MSRLQPIDELTCAFITEDITSPEILWEICDTGMLEIDGVVEHALRCRKCLNRLSPFLDVLKAYGTTMQERMNSLQQAKVAVTPRQFLREIKV